MAIIGIDLGTTNSLAVAYVEDKVVLIPNKFNEYMTPSVVNLNENGDVVVGKIAKERLVTDSNNTTSLFKRNMGTKNLTAIRNKKFLPEELSSFVVQQLISDAEDFLNDKVEEVVISVPAYFNEKQRFATKKIGKLLDVKIERLINEPSAASLANHNELSTETFIVFDFGGGTLDVTVVDCFDNVTSICSIAGDNFLGGSDFDLLIAEDICYQNAISFQKLSDDQKEDLLLQAEKIKIKLESNNKVESKIYIGDEECEYEITNKKLRIMASHILSSIIKVITNAVNSSGFDVREIDKLILVGGSCHMSLISEYLQEKLTLPIVKADNLDMSVALGLGKYIGIKMRNENVKDLVLTDICPFSLAITTQNEDNSSKNYSSVIIPKNTVLPASRSTHLTTVRKGQSFVNLKILQGEGLYEKDNLLLASTIIKIPRNKESHEEFILNYIYDINSMLCVELTILSTNEVLTYYVDENSKLKLIGTKEVEKLKKSSINLSKEDEIELLYEKVNRMLLQCDKRKQDELKSIIYSFDSALVNLNNNLRKRAQLISETKYIIDEIEANLNSNSILKSQEDNEFIS